MGKVFVRSSTTYDLWKHVLSDGTMFGDPALNVVGLREFGDFMVYMLVGTENWLVARNRLTGTEYRIRPSAGAGGCFDAAFDGRYIGVEFALMQGKHSSVPGELLYSAFDTVTPGWLDFSGQPPLNVYRAVGASVTPNFLWVHNGNQVEGWFGNDPGGQIINHKLVSTSEINWTSHEKNTQGLVVNYYKWKRLITLPSGSMSGIIQFPNGSWPVDINNPTEPDWLRL